MKRRHAKGNTLLNYREQYRYKSKQDLDERTNTLRHKYLITQPLTLPDKKKCNQHIALNRQALFPVAFEVTLHEVLSENLYISSDNVMTGITRVRVTSSSECLRIFYSQTSAAALLFFSPIHTLLCVLFGRDSCINIAFEHAL